MKRYFSLTKKLLFCSGATLLFSTVGHSTVYYSIDGATGSTSETVLDYVYGANNGDWNIHDKGDSRLVYHSKDRRGASKIPSFFYTGAYSGSGRSLKLRIAKAGSNSNSASEKTEYVVAAHNSPYAFPQKLDSPSTKYYTGFAVRLGDHNAANFDNSIHNRLMFYQCWQGSGPSNSSNPGFNPPLSFQLKPNINGTQKLQIWVKSMYHVPHDPSDRYTFGTWDLPKGQWYRFVVSGRMSYPGDYQTGDLYVLRIKPNGSESTLINDTSIEWGYKPTSRYANNDPNKVTGVNDAATSTINIYRAKQDKNHVICFDSIRHTNSLSQAKP